jgi:hypothetical protein
MKVDIAALRKTLPKMPGVTPEKFEDEMRKTLKNITIRPEAEMAAKLVYLDLCVGMPKATAVKRCLDKAFDDLWRQTAEAGIQMAAQSIETRA